MNYIYCYTNKLNDKKYVGQTNCIERRKREHLSNAFNEKSKDYDLLFHKKIREYGIETFAFEIIDKTDNIQQINSLEEDWIDRLKSFVGENGYNLTKGGNQSFIQIDDSKILEIKKMIKTGSKYDEISNRFNISKSLISGINNGLYYFQELEKYPLFNYKIGEDNYDKLNVLLKTTNLSLTEIAKQLNISHATVKKYNLGLLSHKESETYPIRNFSSAQMKSKITKDLLANSNFSLLEIAKQTSSSIRTVNRINSGETHYEEDLNYPLRK